MFKLSIAAGLYAIFAALAAVPAVAVFALGG